MPPKLHRLDHVHVYVRDREKAAAWYQKVLGFTITQEYAFWAEDQQGPLTIEDSSGAIHLALFQREESKPGTSIAFGTDAAEFLAWKKYLESQQLLVRCSDHDAAWSLYFHDLDKNMHEITTYDHQQVREVLG